MKNQHEHELPNGQKVYTGNNMPDTLPLSFKPFPDTHFYDLDVIADIQKDKEANGHVLEQAHADHVTNQGNRSSCNAYMVYWILAYCIWQQTGKWPKLGPEYLYTKINGGKDQGSMLDDGMVECTDVGMPRQEIDGKIIVPYQAYRQGDFDVEQWRIASQDAENHRFAEAYQAPTDSLERLWWALLSCITGRGAVGVAVHVGRRYMQSNKTAGLDRGPGNHAVPGAGIRCMTARPKSVADFRIKSPQSWDVTFANRGFTDLTIHHLEEPMRYHGIYCVRSATTDKSTLSQTRIKS